MHIYPIAIPVICKMWIVRHTVYLFFGKGVDGLAVTCNGRIDLATRIRQPSIRLTFTILLSYNSKLNRLTTHCISQRLGRLGDFGWRSSNTGVVELDGFSSLGNYSSRKKLMSVSDANNEEL
jgi:hypothetical protein